jgi:hypothetical protein
MNAIPIADRLALNALNRRAVLDAIRDWARDPVSPPTLDERLWEALTRYASEEYLSYSVTEVKALIADLGGEEGPWRNKGRDPPVPGAGFGDGCWADAPAAGAAQAPPERLLDVALRRLTTNRVVWRGDVPVIPVPSVSTVQHLLAECNPDVLQCYLWAIEYREPECSGGLEGRTLLRRLPDEVLRALMHGPMLPEVDDPTLQRLAREGYAEIHRHLNGSTLPGLLWSYLIAPPYRLYAGELAGRLDGLESGDCIALLRTARDLRNALVRRLLNRNWHAHEAEEERRAWSRDVLTRLAAMYERLPLGITAVPGNGYGASDIFGHPSPTRCRDPAAALPLGEDEPLIAERAFLHEAFRHLHLEREDSVYVAALHAYLLIHHLLWRALSQSRIRAKGFERFARCHGIFLREPEWDKRLLLREDRYLHRLIQAQRTGGVRWMELRMAPSGRLRREVALLDRALKKLRTEESRPRHDADPWNASLEQALASYSGGPQSRRPQESPRDVEGRRGWSLGPQSVGLIFHFIKRPDLERRRGQLQPCRHNRLRRAAMKEARAIAGLHRSGRGRYVLGIDAANSELDAGPEVFVPAIRWLREHPARPDTAAYRALGWRFCPRRPARLGLTYHVGEDFLHLVSGLRAVDEAVRFLRMGAGDRLGHGLALGVSYARWCRRMGGEVAMTRGARLDDLVWMRRRLYRDAAVFDSLLPVLEEEIRRLTLEVYGPGCEGLDWQLLYLAWTKRGEDPLAFTLDESARRLGREVFDLPYAHACRQVFEDGDVGGDARAETGVCAKLVKMSDYERRACELFRIYHLNSAVRERYDQVIRVSLQDSNELWQRAVTWIQDRMLDELVSKRIAIEVNPTSNLCIGPFDELTEHPVFRWHPPDETATAARPTILVGSDDPGVFATELAFEYAALGAAAQARGATPRQIGRWLTELRDAGKEFCFLNTYSSEDDEP